MGCDYTLVCHEDMTALALDPLDGAIEGHWFDLLVDPLRGVPDYERAVRPRTVDELEAVLGSRVAAQVVWNFAAPRGWRVLLYTDCESWGETAISHSLAFPWLWVFPGEALC